METTRITDLLTPFLMGMHDFGSELLDRHDWVEVVCLEAFPYKGSYVLEVELYEHGRTRGVTDIGPRAQHWRVRLECRDHLSHGFFRDPPLWEDVRGAGYGLTRDLSIWYDTHPPGGGRSSDKLP
ncbi:hypothetical protein [Streptomyces sp. NPDC057702]|uniref:hypothetical protein n=1 Tax=unclassified Streptomyces TaxID=2593676 RepID=UPI003689497F